MKKRIVFSLLVLAAVLVWTPAASAQEAKPETPKAARLSLDDILTLMAGGVTPARVATLVKDRGVGFALTPEIENKLRIAGADDSLLLAIAKAQPPPPKPEPEPAKPPPAPPPPVDKARAALEKAIESVGGLAALESLRDATRTWRITSSTPQGEVAGTGRSYFVFPNKLRVDVQFPTGLFAAVFDGQQGWTMSGDTVQNMTPAQTENWRRTVPLSLLLLEAHRGQRTVQFGESVLLEGNQCDVIVLTDSPGFAVRLYVEKATGRVLRQEWQGLSETGALVQNVKMSYDFRPVGSLILPFREVTWQDGQKSLEIAYESLQSNTSVDPSLFARPAASSTRKQPSRRRQR